MRVVETYDIGARVLRGPDWVYENQDIVDVHGEEVPNAIGLGIIIYPRSDQDDGWAQVRWNTGHVNDYRIGFEDCYDLIYADDSSFEKIFDL